MRVLTIIWSAAVAVNLVIWGILALTTGEAVHPWWLYVAGPPGAVLAVLYAAGIGRPRR
jgi:TRAP-type C4-dicarboxylate transport system permease small subunit